MPERKINMVGSLPPGTDWAEFMSEHADALLSMPVDFEQFWIIDYLAHLRDRRAFEVVREGDFSGYDEFMVYRPANGLRSLTHGDVSLRRAEKIADAAARYAALPESAQGSEKPPFMVCRAHPIDLALFTFLGGPDRKHPLRTVNGATLALRAQHLYETDLVAEQMQLNSLSYQHSIDIRTQLEEPHVLYGLLQLPRPARPLAARWLARRTAHVLGLITTPETVLHLCYGRLHGEAAVTPESLAEAVRYLNELARVCYDWGIPLPKAHIPAAYGSDPAPTDPEFYRPLERLAQVWSNRLIAGILDPAPGGLGRSATALRLFESAADTPVEAVSLSCGAGHLTAPQLGQVMSIATALVGVTP